MIEIHNLTKKYKNRLVLNVKYLKFDKGKTYLLIGSNGAGKSTLVKSILKIIDFNGKIDINTSKIGFLPERFPEISYINTLTFLRSLKIDNNEEIINKMALFFNLDLKKTISSLSKGNLQKVMIIQAIMNNAMLMIFDEPLNGLDPNMQNKFLEIIKSLKNSERCIIITTHYPKYYEGLYDEIVYLNNGEVCEYI